MPRHLHYVEPFAGGAAVLLERDPNDASLWLSPHKGVSEVINDINSELMNFWSVLSDVDDFQSFLRQVQAMPLAREAFEVAQKHLPHWPEEANVARAVAFFILARQSRAGTFKGFTSLTRNRLRRGINGNASEWLGAVDGLAAVHARLQPVVLENMPAIDLIAREDATGTLCYCDPPYVHDTRMAKSAYLHEMTDEQHKTLLLLLQSCKGKVMLSGYRCPLYDERLKEWNRQDFDLPNNAAGGQEKRRMTESLWMNY